MSTFLTPTRKAVLGVIGVFIIGWLAGVLTTSAFVGHKFLALYRGGVPAWAQVVEKRLTRNLSLDDTQKQQIHAAFLDNVTQRVALQKQLQPQVQALNQATVAKINAVLRPDQQEKFKANIESFKARAGRGFFGTSAPDSSATPAK